MTPEQAAALRAPFAPELIGKIPKGGTWLDYVGHAAVTDRLLEVDPAWHWEPATFSEYDGAPTITERGNDSVMWIRLTVCDITRLGVGIVATKAAELEKQLISDAIRNAAMRFGVALDLWSKEDLGAGHRDDDPEPPTDPTPVSSAKVEELKARCIVLKNFGVNLTDHRHRWRLPILDASDNADLVQWEAMLKQLEDNLDAVANRKPDEPAHVSAEEYVATDEYVDEGAHGDTPETEEQLRARMEVEVAALKPLEVRQELEAGHLELNGNPKMLRERLVAYRVWCALGQEELPPADPSPQEVLIVEEIL